MVKILVVDDGNMALKEAIKRAHSKSEVEAQPEPLNDLLCLTWFEKAEPGKECSLDTRCEYATPDGDCYACRTMNGRFMDEVNNYASTCDACGELTSHVELEMNEENQLGTCPTCLGKGLKA